MSSFEGSGARGPELSHLVELTFAADPDLVVLARMVAAVAASKVGFGIEQVEDFRLAVDELCLALIREHAADGHLELTFGWSDDTVEVVACHALGPGASSRVAEGRRQPDEELSSRILDALVDEHGVEDSSGTARAWLRVRRARQG
jgi:anti-sigma regulatory factor (Ser/Thr protein kinase)